ncbi:MAG: hypothetical protein C4318_07095 [Acidimicrobiia bacterium]
MAAFLTDEWIELARSIYEEVDEVPEELRQLSAIVSVRVNGCPHGDPHQRFFVIVDEGLVIDMGRGDPPVEADAVVEGDFQTAKELLLGEISAEAVITQGRVKIEGDIAKLVAFATQQKHPVVQELTAKIRAQTD